MVKNFLPFIALPFVGAVCLANIALAAELVQTPTVKESGAERLNETEATKTELVHQLICANIKRAFAGFYAEHAAIISRDQTSEQAAAAFVASFIQRPATYYSLPLGRVGTQERTNYISVVDLFRTVAAVKDRSLMVSNPDELRYLPNSLEGVHIFMVASELAPLTEEKVAKVAKFAKFHRVNISVIVVNSSLPLADQNILNSLPIETGGYYIDMVRLKEGCFAPERA